MRTEDFIEECPPFAAKALYVHIPFCLAKCRYCDFNSVAPSAGRAHDPRRLGSYAGAVICELENYAGQAGFEAPGGLASMYVGGGTPTCLPVGCLSDIVAKAYDAFGFAPGCEVTVEANPGTVDEAKLAALVRSGVNRVSLGVQSMNDGELELLGRIHDAREARRAVDAAKCAGFSNISIDLIYGIPLQTMDDWRRTVDRALEMDVEHISAYALKVEEGTPMESLICGGRLPPPDDDLAEDMSDYLIEALGRSGYHRYEISNYSKPGKESKHNSTYWRYEPYIGVGAGAWGFTGLARYVNTFDIEEYVEQVGLGRFPVSSVEPLDESERMAESAFMGLRLAEGLDTERWSAMFGRDFYSVYGGKVDRLEKSGLIIRRGSMLRLTPRGMSLGNRVFMEFLPE